ncbi:hypothetical protein [Streptomyces sp. NPDC006285]|uniref:hypothetical protein n=1 Tax=Streptomyces sp. NPDC006285 TaxID=3364742 RepID=UPI0036C2D3D6
MLAQLNSEKLVQLTVLGSEILPGDLLAVRNWAQVEEIGSRDGVTTSLHILDGGIRIVGDSREYVVRREVAEDTSRVVLVVGNAETPEALEDLTAFAFDVADRLRVPARIAVGRDYDVTQFAGVVIADSWLDSVSSAVLGVEAQGADLFLIDADALYAYDVDSTCGHCGEGGDAAPVLAGDTWTTSVHASCVDAHERATALGLIPLAV